MNHSLIKKITTLAFITIVLLVPLNTNAQDSSSVKSWLSNVFGWQKPIISHLSNIFEARKDNVENNSITRKKLLDWRLGVVPIDTTPKDTVSTDFSNDNLDVSSSTIYIPYNLFKEKRTALVTQLLTAENSLKTSANNLSNLINNSITKSDNMSITDNTLTQVRSDIDNVDFAINTFKNYEPDSATSSDIVNLQIPQSYLEIAITAIQTAKTSLKNAITEARISLQ